MLKELRVDNYVLIKDLRFQPAQGFNIITGETGAGKSILLGALGLILGDRADTKHVSDLRNKCVIEGVFDVRKLNLSALFEEHDLDFYEETILRREILISGKSRAFVNDTPVSLSVLRTIGQELVDIHSQHQTLRLGSPEFLFQWLDTVCKTTKEAEAYKKAYQTLKSERKRLEVLEEEVNQQLAEQDYFQFLYNELEEINLELIAKQDIESEHEMLTHADEIGDAVGMALQSLREDEDSSTNRLGAVQYQLQKLKGGEELEKLVERFNGISIELDEVIRDLESYGMDVQPNPERLQEINEVVSKLNQLQTKHRVTTLEELIEVKSEIENKLSDNENRESELNALRASILKLDKEANDFATDLHQKRVDCVPEIETSCNHDLSYLGMPNAKLVLELTKENSLTPYGLTNFQLLFSAHQGGSLNPAHKVASGGELSRLMLILKTHMAKNRNLPTIIFDEIDTGVSGEIALKMGELISQLSSKMQVISITHLPQIASKGNAHFYVYKQLDNDQTTTFVKQLDDTERVMVLAQMLSGENPTEGAIANAKELLN